MYDIESLKKKIREEGLERFDLRKFLSYNLSPNLEAYLVEKGVIHNGQICLSALNFL